MIQDLHSNLRIPQENLDAFNRFLTDPSNSVIAPLMEIIGKYGTPAEINAKAKEAGKLENLMARLKEQNSPYLADLAWIQEQIDAKAFISMADYRKKHCTDPAAAQRFDDDFAVTLEISALQYFPWLISQVKHAIANQELMPGRYIRVRLMKEQENDNGDILAVAAAMRMLGVTYVETLDTKGADGSNIHLGGPDTITGYFGGVGQPNGYALKWIDEFLYYYTNYGVQQVLNVNPGTIFLAYMIHKLGIDIEFKISVFMGNDNPYSVLWTLMTARLFSREDGTTPLIGFNFSNSVNNETIRFSADIRKGLDFEKLVRFEHHITETYKSIVIQPYDRTAELVELGNVVANISAKHEGGPVDIDKERAHPSDILDYFSPKEAILQAGLMDAMEINFLDKHESVQRTAKALTRAGVAVYAAPNLH
ncbi:hypothetical protein KKF84_19690 [Myxococcota bacterium]|nr:hypothetical protein [Myxococcota bacterium]MBU1537547.1 hypothetical protein [Myxococcota bacterium]